MKIEADLEMCVAAGMCALTASELFSQNEEDGQVVVLQERPSPDLEEGAREAVSLCPSGALSLHED